METALQVVGRSKAELKQQLDQYFKPHEEAANNIAAQLQLINVTDASQVAEIKEAGEIRKKLQSARLKVDKLHKDMKSDALTTGQVLDEIKRYVRGIIDPLESKADEIERFEEIQEKKRKDQLRNDRSVIMVGILGDEANMAAIDYGDISQTMFDSIVLGAKAKKAQDVQAEKDRVKKIADDAAANEKLKKDNERLSTQNTKLKEAVATGDPFSVKRGVSGMSDKDRMIAWGKYIENLAAPTVEEKKYGPLVNVVHDLLVKVNQHIIKNL